MKKWITGALAILLGVMSIAVPFSGMHIAEAKTTEETDRKLNIVTTIFPEYDWTRNILGNREADVNLTMLLDNGTDLHSFQPAVKDIMKVSSCDLLIYVGGESDQWIEDALESAQNKDMKTINLMEVLGDTIKEEETVEGMQDSEHEHGHEDEHAHEGEDEKEYDEHVWTSIRNAERMSASIADELMSVDSKNSKYYNDRKTNYISQLDSLDKKFTEVANNKKRDTLVFGDRFPFLYFVSDYNLGYECAFPGCSHETEPSTAVVSHLVDFTREHDIPVVFYLELSSGKIARIISEDSSAKTMQFSSCHNVTKDDFENGATYISVMEQNLEALKEALY